MKLKNSLYLILLFVLAISLASCIPYDESILNPSIDGEDSTEDIESGDSESNPQEPLDDPVAGIQIGDLCPDISVKLIEKDETISVLANKGKINIINFWGTWCTPCVQEIPGFIEVSNQYVDDVTLLEVHDSGNYSSEEALSFIEGWESLGTDNVIWAVDDANEGAYKALGGISSYPRTIIIDKNGIVQYLIDGKTSKETLQGYIASLLQ